MKILITLFLILFTTFVFADGSWWTARDTLKSDLKMYESPTSKSKVIDKIKKGIALKQLLQGQSNKSWIYITYNEQNGYVSKRSLQRYQVNLDSWETFVFPYIKLARTDEGAIVVSVSGKCYQIKQEHILELPSDKAITMQQYLNLRGGFGTIKGELSQCNSN